MTTVTALMVLMSLERMHVLIESDSPAPSNAATLQVAPFPAALSMMGFVVSSAQIVKNESNKRRKTVAEALMNGSFQIAQKSVENSVLSDLKGMDDFRRVLLIVQQNGREYAMHYSIEWQWYSVTWK